MDIFLILPPEYNTDWTWKIFAYKNKVVGFLLNHKSNLPGNLALFFTFNYSYSLFNISERTEFDVIMSEPSDGRFKNTHAQNFQAGPSVKQNSKLHSQWLI